MVLNALPGSEITAVGFWNGDGQADTLVATAYDASDMPLGSVGAFKGNFAGLISDVPISRIVFDRNTGDGWNHLDGLQTNVRSAVIPEPSTVVLLSSGLAVLGLIALHRNKSAWM